MSAWRWSVSYETATIARGEAPTEDEATRRAVVEHDSLAERLNPDSLAWHVREVTS